MKITAKGQVTIPIEIRKELGLLPRTEVEFELAGHSLLVRPVKTERKGRGRALVEHLRGKGTIRMTTDEILALMRS